MMENNHKPLMINQINLEIPYKQIMSRLGYCSSTILSTANHQKIDRLIQKGYSFIQLSSSILRLNITKKDTASTEIAGKYVFSSQLLAQFLSVSNEVFLIGLTSGQEIIQYRDQLIQENDLTSSIIIDAVASEMTEKAADWIQDYLMLKCIKEGKKLTKHRYSPGYGDFSLENQKIFYNVLKLDKLNIRLSEKNILIPEKSITAIIGIY